MEVQAVINTSTNFNKITDTIKETEATDQNSLSLYNKETIDLENLSDKKIKEIEDALNNEAASLDFALNFQVHRKSGKLMVKIVDKHSHKIIKEIPPESFLDFLSKFEETIGILFDKKT